MLERCVDVPTRRAPLEPIDETGPGPRCRVVSPGPRAFVVEGLDSGFPIPEERASFARATGSGLPKTRLRLGNVPVIGFPNPHGPLRPAAITM